jgi:hypothetical protein
MSPYREPGELPPIAIAKPSSWPLRWAWGWRLALVFHFPILAGALHDAYSSKHAGLLWGAGGVSLLCFFVGIFALIEAPPPFPRGEE